jgi:hypothetical protein
MPEIGDASTGIEASRRFFGMSALGVRREKAALSSGCKPHPVTAPAGSNRSSHGGNEVAEAFGERVTIYGDSASVQAVTRVNAEQASKRTMRSSLCKDIAFCLRAECAAFLANSGYGQLNREML